MGIQLCLYNSWIYGYYSRAELADMDSVPRGEQGGRDFKEPIMASRDVQLSIVVPLLNEQDSIEELYNEIKAGLSEEYGNYEIIFIDDGSTDGSFDVLARLHGLDGHVRVISFRRNFGQTAALSAGFEYSRGKIIVAMDADRQNDPADIPKLLDKLNEGYDIISGWRKKRHDAAIRRRLPSRMANWLIRQITQVELHDFGCTLKAYRREVLEDTKLYGEMHRFIPAVAGWGGAKVGEIVVNHRPRTTGIAKYGLGRTVKVLLDLITVKFLGSYSTKPIYVFGGLGLLCSFGAVLSGAAVLYQKFISARHLAMNRNPLLILTTLLIITSLQFVLMGLLAEMLVRTYHESQGRPIYTIRQVLERREGE